MNRFHSEAELVWSYICPLANHITTNKTSANREMQLFSRLYPSFGYLRKIFPPRGSKYSLFTTDFHTASGVSLICSFPYFKYNNATHHFSLCIESFEEKHCEQHSIVFTVYPTQYILCDKARLSSFNAPFVHDNNSTSLLIVTMNVFDTKYYDKTYQICCNEYYQCEYLKSWVNTNECASIFFYN